MEAFAVSLSTIAIAEIGDRTQLLSLLLAARYRRPIPIIAGILIATLANHAVAASIGVWVGNILRPKLLDILVGASMLSMALWTLKPDSLDGDTTRIGAAGAFVATLTSFFLAEIGDKTQIATVALGAAYPTLVPVIAGTTLGMLAANAPVVFLGRSFAERLNMEAIRHAACALFAILGAVFLGRGLWS
jgi:putative Ca2+/H+ antiporter (TMEM165/GDT1 family)